LADELQTAYLRCQELSPQLDAAVEAEDLAAVRAVQQQLLALQAAVEGGVRTAKPPANVRRWLQVRGKECVGVGGSKQHIGGQSGNLMRLVSAPCCAVLWYDVHPCTVLRCGPGLTYQHKVSAHSLRSIGSCLGLYTQPDGAVPCCAVLRCAALRCGVQASVYDLYDLAFLIKCKHKE
jgi:hypothetical protein